MFGNTLSVSSLLALALATLGPALAADAPSVDCGEDDVVDDQDTTRLENADCRAHWQPVPALLGVLVTTACPPDAATGGRACVVAVCTTTASDPPVCAPLSVLVPPPCDSPAVTPHSNGSVQARATYAATGHSCADVSTPPAACTQPVLEPGPGDYRVGVEDPSGAEGCPILVHSTCSTLGPHVEEDRADVTLPGNGLAGKCWVWETTRPPRPDEACTDQPPRVQPGIWPIWVSFRSYYGECYRWYVWNPYYAD